MPPSTTIHVQVNVDLEAATGLSPAGFGAGMVIAEDNTVATDTRLHGPFTSAAAVEEYGFATTDPQYLAAVAFFSQSPRATQLYLGRRDAADADDGVAFNAILAENPGAWYGCTSVLRDTAEALALRTAVEAAAYPKIAIVQYSNIIDPSVTWRLTFGGTFDVGDLVIAFDGYDIAGSPVGVSITVGAGPSPATLALAIAALAAELATQTGTGGTIAGVVVPGSIVAGATTLEFRITPGLAAGTVTATNTIAGGTAAEAIVAGDVDDGLGAAFFALQGTRCALLEHADDEYADAAMLSNGLSMDLDRRKGIWGFRKLLGITPSTLTDARRDALRAVNANYFSTGITSAGAVTRAFTAQGWMPNGLTNDGRRIDITTSLDWAKARKEEALMNALLTASHGIPMTDAGINQLVSASARVTENGIAAGHFVRFTVPDDDLYYPGEQTPVIFPPDVATMTAAERASRSVTMDEVVYLTSFAERVVFNVNARQ